MNAERRDDAEDRALVNDLEGLVSVDPSAEFMARCRTRIAREPASAGWRVPGLWSLPAMAAVLAVVVLLWPHAEAPLPPQPTQPAVAVANAVREIPEEIKTGPDPVKPRTAPVTPAVAFAGAVDVGSPLPLAVADLEDLRRFLEGLPPTQAVETIQIAALEIDALTVREDTIAPLRAAPLTVEPIPPIEPIQETEGTLK